jgi:integrase
MARNQRSRGTGSLFRVGKPHAIPADWTVFCDEEGKYGNRGLMYAMGPTVAHGSKRHRVNEAGTAIMVPTGAWIATYRDHTGKRREHSTRTTDRQAAERILTKLVADDALRRDGVIDPRDDRFAKEGRRPFAEHVAAYIAHCERIGLAAEHIASKERHLRTLAEVASIGPLSDLTADALERYLSEIKASGRSSRTVNFARQIAVAFATWCVKHARLEDSPLGAVPTMDESRDRRRVRRPLTDTEMTQLLTVARERGREAWYLAAALAGLRRGDLERLTWSDINFTDSTLTIRLGKSRRTDTLPMHPQLAQSLREQLAAHPALPTARVWSNPVGNATRAKDFLRAGIAREVDVLDADGKPVMIGKGKRARVKTKIVAEDEEGRVIDLHALRTTLGTQLARAGVTPQVAQRIMRHSDYRTTLKHYTVLGLTDTAAAMDRLPGIAPERVAQAATGTMDATADTRTNRPQLMCQLSGRGMGQNSAASRGEAARGTTSLIGSEPLFPKQKTPISAALNQVERKRLELSTPSLQS